MAVPVPRIAATTVQPAGRLVYVMGASGAGKDSIIGYARERHGDLPHVVFAHRYITRPAAAGGENHIELAPAEFLARRNGGCFALSWRSHGNDYGLGCEIDLWMARGFSVVANGSRAHFDQAAARYASLLPILVQVDPGRLDERLKARDREGESGRTARLAQAKSAVPAHPALVTIDNNGLLSTAGEALVAVLRRLRPPASARAMLPDTRRTDLQT